MEKLRQGQIRIYVSGALSEGTAEPRLAGQYHGIVTQAGAAQRQSQVVSCFEKRWLCLVKLRYSNEERGIEPQRQGTMRRGKGNVKR